MTTLRVTWKDHPNPLCSTLVCNVDVFRYLGEDDRSGLSAHEEELIDGLTVIPGVKSITCDIGEVTVVKKQTVSWKKVKQEVESLLAKWCGAQNVTNENDPLYTKALNAVDSIMDSFRDLTYTLSKKHDLHPAVIADLGVAGLTKFVAINIAMAELTKNAEEANDDET